MNTKITMFTLVTCLSLGTANAQNLLVNGDFNDPGVHESDLATGWDLFEGPLVPGTRPEPDFDPNTATFATFADRTGGGVGLWLRAFTGTAEDPTDGDEEHQVFATLYQMVPASAGVLYELSAWSRFETHWPGGVDNLNAAGTDDSDPSDGLPSPTDSYLFMEFFDASDFNIGTEIIELAADGQTNDGVWRKHTIAAVAPPGTASIIVGSGMVDGVLNPGVNPQSAFLDDFALTVVPEPASELLACIALGMLARANRRRRR